MNPLAWLEADMARHMLVEIPLVFAAGAWLGGRTPDALRKSIARFDAYGLTGWTFAALVAAFWMIPAALDAAVASAAMNAAKFASLLAAGFLLRNAMRRSPIALEAFFVGNFTWMGCTVGIVYQDAESRLCLAYLAESQQRAGIGLLGFSVALLVAYIVLRGVPGKRGYILSSDSAGVQPSSGGAERNPAIRPR